MLLRCAGVLVMIGAVLLAACASNPVPTTQPIPTPVFTPGPLAKTVRYWDLGVSIPYPDNWAAPQFLAGSLTLAPSLEAAHGQVQTQPVIHIQISDPVRDLHLSKDATLSQIAAAVNSG